MSLTPTALTPTADPAVFTVPEDYVAGTLTVLDGGIVQDPATAYVLSDDVIAGNRTVTFAVAPSGWVAGSWVAAGTSVTGHYLTAARLQARVGGAGRYLDLTDDDRDSTPDAAVEEELLTQVDQIVDGFARRAGYSVPLSADDISTILPWLEDIANYRAQTRAGGKASDGDLKLYNDAMSLLHQIGTGAFPLPSFQTTEPIKRFGFDTEDTVTGGPEFTRDTMRGF